MPESIKGLLSLALAQRRLCFLEQVQLRLLMELFAFVESLDGGVCCDL